MNKDKRQLTGCHEKLSVLIPVYNERYTVATLIDQVVAESLIAVPFEVSLFSFQNHDREPPIDSMGFPDRRSSHNA